MNIKVEAFGATHVGQRRDKNEDQFFIGELNGSMKVHHTSIAIEDCSTVFGQSQGHLFLVADGLGGHAAGERASALAISAVSSYALNRLHWLVQSDSDDEQAEKLQAIAAECQKRLIESARRHPNERGMATTLTLAIVIWPKLYVIHIGDSRCYLYRDGKLAQLTRDHTLGQLCSEFTDSLDGELAKHALWNVVSSEGEGTPIADIVQIKLMPEDQLLLCTDGLYNHLNDNELGSRLDDSGSAQEVCDRFVLLANERGGHDNITVIVSRFTHCEQMNDIKAMVETRVPLEEVLEASEVPRASDDTDEYRIPDFARSFEATKEVNE